MNFHRILTFVESTRGRAFSNVILTYKTKNKKNILYRVESRTSMEENVLKRFNDNLAMEQEHSPPLMLQHCHPVHLIMESVLKRFK